MNSVYGRKARLDITGHKHDCVVLGISHKDINGKITPVFVAEMTDGSVVAFNVTQFTFYPKFNPISTQ